MSAPGIFPARKGVSHTLTQWRRKLALSLPCWSRMRTEKRQSGMEVDTWVCHESESRAFLMCSMWLGMKCAHGGGRTSTGRSKHFFWSVAGWEWGGETGKWAVTTHLCSQGWWCDRGMGPTASTNAGNFPRVRNAFSIYILKNSFFFPPKCVCQWQTVDYELSWEGKEGSKML